ncbi:unnamed protein product [Rotaria magnacalcarata]|uniref:Uncharacterized protein n=1 Tax=Rotaria magnacalcarata TaxID=392030 RepID=A0A820G232_9BILA|nr:unnamed protein product [Rotaria magnacalcarata]CAF4270608.1 unnamed protein product [Rotaria magnacalcarata]
MISTSEISLFPLVATDEIDIIHNRLGVYLGGSLENDTKTIGSKLLCQCYDTIKNVLRTTGSSSFYIERGSINIFGASTGNMLSSVFRPYHSNTMSDGTVSRYMYICASAHKPTNLVPQHALFVQPNIVHILIVVRLLVQYRPVLVFARHAEDHSTPVPGSLSLSNFDCA